MSKFLHDEDNNDGEATAIPPVFSENSQAKNLENKTKNDLKMVGEYRPRLFTRLYI